MFSPYVILNRTGLELDVKSKSILGGTSAMVGKPGLSSDSTTKVSPSLFSFINDDRRNRVVLKAGSSTWSKPQSLDAIGSTYETILPSSSGNEEMRVGVAVDEGEGKVS